jgi:ABC-type glycerol-3-phosphate transport system substrate-binding protein
MKLRFSHFLLSAATFVGIACPVPSGVAQDSVKNSVQGPVPSGNVTFAFWGIASQPWQVMIDDFQKTYPNLKVKWTKYSTDEMKQAVRVASSAGKIPMLGSTGAAAWPRPTKRADTRLNLPRS